MCQSKQPHKAHQVSEAPMFPHRLWNPQRSPWCPSWVFLISWLVVLQLFATWRPCCLTTNDLSMEETWVCRKWLADVFDSWSLQLYSWCDWCLLIRKTLCNLLLACGSIMWFFYILTRSASARKHVMLVCSWFMLGARVVESTAGQLETHGKTHGCCCVCFFSGIYILYIYKWTKRQHKILEKWQGGTVLVGMDT